MPDNGLYAHSSLLTYLVDFIHVIMVLMTINTIINLITSYIYLLVKFFTFLLKKTFLNTLFLCFQTFVIIINIYNKVTRKK